MKVTAMKVIIPSRFRQQKKLISQILNLYITR